MAEQFSNCGMRSRSVASDAHAATIYTSAAIKNDAEKYIQFIYIELCHNFMFCQDNYLAHRAQVFK